MLFARPIVMLGHGLKQDKVPRGSDVAPKLNLSYLYHGQGPDYGALRKVFLLLNIDLDYVVVENKHLSFVGVFMYLICI